MSAQTPWQANQQSKPTAEPLPDNPDEQGTETVTKKKAKKKKKAK